VAAPATVTVTRASRMSRASMGHATAPVPTPRYSLPPGRGLGEGVDPLTKSANQRVQPDHTDSLNVQQLELWP
jgi:hypothetical protein